VRPVAKLVVVAVAMLSAVGPVSAVPLSGAARQPGTPFTVLQMNLCLSGTADCYPRTAYPAIVDEAAEQVLRQAVQAVTLNEVCSGDAAEIARRTGYQMRFAAVLFEGARLRCVAPGGRGVFGLAILTKDAVRTSHGQAFAIHADAEERRWICATTVDAVTVCAAHLGTRRSAEERRANDAECVELRGALARYDAAGTTVFGGDVNRHKPCAPATMWAEEDTAAVQLPGIQHVYGSTSLEGPSPRVAVARHTDHDFFLTSGRLRRNHAPSTPSSDQIHRWSITTMLSDAGSRLRLLALHVR
jgi:endonuclease/exonuclease/phosphatase family metal-dependent hydrolase